MEQRYDREELLDKGPVRTFSSEDTAAAFPLGGIGTGNVALGARGEFRDWEIFNHPSKGISLPYSFFAVRAEGEDEPVSRVLESQLEPPYTHWYGYPPTTTAGLPRLEEAELTGEYPIASIEFRDRDLPLEISLEAYTPLIPLDPEDSGIPVAVLEYTVGNPTDEALDVSLVGSLPNVIGYRGREQIDQPYVQDPDLGGNTNEFRTEDGVAGIEFTSETLDEGDLYYGEMGLSLLDADEDELTHKTAWSRGAWWHCFEEFWDDFREDGELEENRYDEPSDDGESDIGSLGAAFSLDPGEDRTLTFLVTWFFPNRRRGWDNVWSDEDPAEAETECCSGADCCSDAGALTRNHYATRFDGAWDVAKYVGEEYGRLRDHTYTFRDALFDSTVPTHVLDAISSQLSVARSTTCQWFEDGTFWGYEGCGEQEGCCEGTCTHVWNYAQSMARIFPSLEREMRRINFEESTDAEGSMWFRTPRPLDGGLDRFDRDQRPAADGQMGTVMRLYREWLYSGDEEFLERLWPKAKQALEFAFDQWDPDEDGVMTEAQHNTYDIEFHGPNTMMGTWYLGALKAGAEMAREMGDDAAADRYEGILESGRERLDEACWNGEYYQQALEDPDEYEYQYGKGSLIDQVVGQWYATMLGLGELLPPDRVERALESLYEHNFLEDFSAHHNCQRTYALNDDAGLLMCTWPDGGRPEVSFPYCDEVMCGFEYQAAAHMIYAGFLEEGLSVSKAIRDRHDGRRRNPWNEFECGNHYARSMANWSVYEALTGYQFDLVGRDDGVNDHGFAFDPVEPLDDGEFRAFWITAQEWGTYRRADGDEEIEVLYERTD